MLICLSGALALLGVGSCKTTKISKKQQLRQEQAYRDSLQKGDQLMTTGGIHVTFVSREGNMATVEVAPGHRMKVQIGSLQPIPDRK